MPDGSAFAAEQWVEGSQMVLLHWASESNCSTTQQLPRHPPLVTESAVKRRFLESIDPAHLRTSLPQRHLHGWSVCLPPSGLQPCLQISRVVGSRQPLLQVCRSVRFPSDIP